MTGYCGPCNMAAKQAHPAGRSRRCEVTMSDQAILVTGAAGFIGFHAARELLAQGRHIVGLDSIND
jgi:UDP-glucuronate 4-epimerase